MRKTEKVVLTNMCRIEDGSRVVMQKRKDSWHGVSFPGGHVEMGEPFTDAVIREVFEETGLTISHPTLCGIKDWYIEKDVRYIVLLYRASEFTGTLRSSEEGEVFWAEKEDILNLPLADSMREMLRVFEETNLSEVFAHEENGTWMYDFK